MNASTYTEGRRKLAGAIATALLITFAAVPAGAADADQSRTDQPQSEAGEKPEAEANKEPQKLEALEEMIVTTGSRLQQAADQVELGPIVSIDAEELLHQGTVRVEELVRSLPSVFTGGQDASNANGASGISTLNLRHLGDTVGAAAQSHVALHQQRRRSQLHPGRSRGAALLRPGRYLELQ